MTESMIALLSFVLTLMVFSYLLGDLPLIGNLYRLAVYIFIGMSAAFTLIVGTESVILPYMQDVLDPETTWTSLGSRADTYIFLAALLVALLLLLKPVRSLTWLTNSVFAVVIVVSASVAVVGALTGTLFPLLHSTAALPDDILTDFDAMVDTLLIFLGTMTALYYFHYQTRLDSEGAPAQSRMGSGLRHVGKVFLVIALGAIYASTILSSLTILTERISFLFQFGA